MDAEKAMNAKEAMDAKEAMHAKKATVVAAVSLKIYYLMQINTNSMDAPLPRQPWQGAQVGCLGS